MSGVTLEELQLAARNHGMPLEALRYAITPPGLHYLLVHYDVPEVDAAAWRLEVSGLVRTELSLSLEDLASRTTAELTATMECAGNGRAKLMPRPVSQPWLNEAVGTARWRGVPLRLLLKEATPASGAVEVLFTGLDRGVEGGADQHYQRSLSLADALESDALLAFEMNGAPLPAQHGFPLRLVVPGWYGMTNVKWLARIDVLSVPFTGYQQSQAYQLRQSEDDDGEPVTRMAPRSLLRPPGIPDFFTRERHLAAGPCELEGRAWSGHGPVTRVEVTTDGGASWRSAELEDDAGSRWAWRRWQASWDAEPGRHRLGSRARDDAGNEQPLEAEWNLGGYMNNSVQWVEVIVE
jgi:DMSO/TMAO reductase YedYZ molybdopterin-dependent catalytic subunit